MTTLSERLREEGIEQGKKLGLQQGMQQGLQEGRQEGMQQGRQEGEVTLLKRQLTRRFGPLDTATEQRLKTATTEEIEQWADNVLDAKTLEDVFTRH